MRFKAGTYNVTPTTLTHSIQWYNGSAWEAVTATVTGPSSGWYSFLAPGVTKKGGLQIKSVATKTGDPNVTTFSNWIDIAPAPVMTETLPSNTALPVISPSAPLVGSAATCPTGSWDGTTPMTFAFQWKLNGVNISGATSASYLPLPGDKTKALTCAVTATNSVGSVTVVSAATSAITDPSDLTLPQVIALLRTAQADIVTLRADLTSQTSRNNTQDGEIAAVESRLGRRIGNVEDDTGGLRERVGAVETQASNTAQDLLDLHADTRLTDLEGRFARFTVTGRLALYLPDTSG